MCEPLISVLCELSGFLDLLVSHLTEMASWFSRRKVNNGWTMTLEVFLPLLLCACMHSPQHTHCCSSRGEGREPGGVGRGGGRRGMRRRRRNSRRGENGVGGEGAAVWISHHGRQVWGLGQLSGAKVGLEVDIVHAKMFSRNCSGTVTLTTSRNRLHHALLSENSFFILSLHNSSTVYDSENVGNLCSAVILIWSRELYRVIPWKVL